MACAKAYVIGLGDVVGVIRGGDVVGIDSHAHVWPALQRLHEGHCVAGVEHDGLAAGVYVGTVIGVCVPCHIPIGCTAVVEYQALPGAHCEVGVPGVDVVGGEVRAFYDDSFSHLEV